jgi:type II secretory pathway component PulF
MREVINQVRLAKKRVNSHVDKAFHVVPMENRESLATKIAELHGELDEAKFALAEVSRDEEALKDAVSRYKWAKGFEKICGRNYVNRDSYCEELEHFRKLKLQSREVILRIGIKEISELFPDGLKMSEMFERHPEDAADLICTLVD